MEKLEGIKTLLFLEGGDYVDFNEFYDDLNVNYDCDILNNLYDHPEKLLKLKEINPDALVIATTDTYHEYKGPMIDAFVNSGYIPTTVIFHSEMSAMAYLDMARQLKAFGTKFYYFHRWDDKDEFHEVTWI